MEIRRKVPGSAGILPALLQKENSHAKSRTREKLKAANTMRSHDITFFLISAALAGCGSPAHDKAMDLAQCRLDENSTNAKGTGWHVLLTADFLSACMRGKGWTLMHDIQKVPICGERLLAPLDERCYEPDRK